MIIGLLMFLFGVMVGVGIVVFSVDRLRNKWFNEGAEEHKVIALDIAKDGIKEPYIEDGSGD
jgi:hypothetical protein